MSNLNVKSNIMKDDTEGLIKNTAKKMFFAEGKFNATTQEIADEAKVNRTLINYYFRSRNNLFKTVFEEAMKQEHEKSETILLSKASFKEKVENFIDYSLEVALEYPFLDIYIVTQINQGGIYKDHEQVDKIMKIVEEDLNNEIEKGNISPIEPLQFILNLVSMVSFPVSIRPLFQESFKISDEKYVEILSQRKEVIIKTLFNKYGNDEKI